MAWFGMMSPYLQKAGMGGQQGQQGMTPGSGMPPYGNAPMPMQPHQFQPGGALPSNVPPMGQQGQQPMNPMQMGMMSGMLAQNTMRPGAATPPWAKISPGSMEGVIEGMPGQEAKDMMQGLSPDRLGILGWLMNQFR